MAESVYGPSWYDTTASVAPERDRLVYDLDVDVCVVGGGLAGLTAARELARRGWSVAVLEASRVGFNASGRNAGIVAPGFSERLERIIERVGLARARELWVLSAGGVDYVRTTIRETQMAAVSPVEGYLSVQRFDSDEQLYAQAELIGEKLGIEVEAWSTAQVREVLKTKAYFQGLHFPGAFHIHPLNYALGLAAEAEAAGVKIFEQTRALEIDAAGVRKRVATASGLVRAGHVVLAGNVDLAPLCPPVSGSILPVAGYMATTAPLGERLLDALTYSGAVCDTRRAGDYHRIVDGDRLLWGGRLGAVLASPRRLAKIMRRDIGKVFPQLGEVEITHAWGGVMGYAVHRMPQIGEVSPGLWVATAFGGHGINTSSMAGELIARAVAHGDDRWRLFASYDLVHAGGRIGQAAVKVLSWSMRIRDALDEQLASHRAVTRRRKEAFAARASEEAKRRVAEQAARLAVEEVERRAAEEAERLAAEEAALAAAEQAAAVEQAAAAQEAQLRAAQEAALAAEEAERRAAQEAAYQASLAAEAAKRRAEAERAARPPIPHADDAAALAAVQQVAREAAERAGRIAAEEAAHRIAQEARRMAPAAPDGAKAGAEFLPPVVAGAPPVDAALPQAPAGNGSRRRRFGAFDAGNGPEPQADRPRRKRPRGGKARNDAELGSEARAED
jgi:glycine/D-amino acid oxidase-like deaminating enzyme